uniref:Uncharacterized protein n=1 Tax=Hyaloperonospora arabidopsidis (strain Emoy2) TaxID=559515 RepID=M4BER9_HYAAE
MRSGIWFANKSSVMAVKAYKLDLAWTGRGLDTFRCCCWAANASRNVFDYVTLGSGSAHRFWCGVQLLRAVDSLLYTRHHGCGHHLEERAIVVRGRTEIWRQADTGAVADMA